MEDDMFLGYWFELNDELHECFYLYFILDEKVKVIELTKHQDSINGRTIRTMVSLKEFDYSESEERYLFFFKLKKEYMDKFLDYNVEDIYNQIVKSTQKSTITSIAISDKDKIVNLFLIDWWGSNDIYNADGTVIINKEVFEDSPLALENYLEYL